VASTLRLPRRLCAAAAAAATLAAGLSGGAPGMAMAAACPPPPTPLEAFLGSGDANSYVMATGGDFGARSPAWTLSGGATRVNDQAPDPFASTSGAGALFLPPGSSATSPCTTAPGIVGWVRFYARSAGASAGGLRVEVIVHGTMYEAGTVSAGGGWAPTSLLDSGAPFYKGAVAYQVRLTPVGPGAAFTVDGVYVDPLMHR
jgi:hypothetical protein